MIEQVSRYKYKIEITIFILFDTSYQQCKREDFYKYMYHELPPIDLLIRTGGKKRVSNFMLYEMSYAEFYFTITYFPDFDKSEFNKALFMYENRDRRFGGLHEENR